MIHNPVLSPISNDVPPAFPQQMCCKRNLRVSLEPSVDVESNFYSPTSTNRITRYRKNYSSFSANGSRPNGSSKPTHDPQNVSNTRSDMDEAGSPWSGLNAHENILTPATLTAEKTRTGDIPADVGLCSNLGNYAFLLLLLALLYAECVFGTRIRERVYKKCE